MMQFQTLMLCLSCFLLPSLGIWGGPKVVVSQKDLNRDLGIVRPGDDLKYEITFRNEGDALARVKPSKRSCGGCLPLSMVKQNLEPGESTVLKVHYPAGRRSGVQKRQTFVESNDPAHSFLGIKTSWTVDPIVEIRPEEFFFGRKAWLEPLRSKIVVDPRRAQREVKVIKIVSMSEHVKCGQARKNGDGKIELPVEILATAPAGDVETTVSITMDYVLRKYQKDGKTTTTLLCVDIPVKGQVTGPLRCFPRLLNFGRIRQGTAVSCKTTVENDPRGGEFRVLSLAYKDRATGKISPDRPPFLQDCQLRTEKDGTRLVEATLAPATMPGSHVTTVLLKTNCLLQPEIPLPVLVVVE